MEWQDRIIIDPAILVGKPIVKTKPSSIAKLGSGEYVSDVASISHQN